MKRLSWVVLGAALVAVAGDPPAGPKGGGGKEVLFQGQVAVANASSAGAEIAAGFGWRLDADNFGAKDPIVADAKGHFEKSIPWPRGGKDKVTFLAVDKAHKLGAGMELKKEDLARPVTFRLTAMVRVKVKVTSKDAKFKTAGMAVRVNMDDAGTIGEGTTKEDGLTILVPPGAYELRFRQEGWMPLEAKILVPQGKPEFTAPAVELRPSFLAANMGQVMPEWHIADAIGLPRDSKLASFRGKWLLTLFWREGCASCRGWGIPNLVKFHDRHADWKARLQIVAFHNKDASSAKDLDQFLSGQEGMEWGVMSLPFHVLIDSPSQSTVDEWGPGEFPYAVLIDPDGKLQGKGKLEEVEKQLQELLK